MMKILFIYFVLIVVSQNTYAQSKASFIPTNYSILDSLVVDFNKDNIPDFIMAVRSNLEDTLSQYSIEADDFEENYPRFLIILQGINFRNYKLKALNDSLLLCRYCGGQFDPFARLTFEQDTLIISQWGGSAWRWGVDYVCLYDNSDGEWYIVEENSFTVHIFDPENTQEYKTISIKKKLDRK